MKTKSIVLALFVLMAFFPSSNASPQEEPALAAKVTAVLVKFPAENAADREAFAAELVTLGPAAMRDLCGRLAAPGADDDSLIRFALDALSLHLGRGKAESERSAFVKEILKALDEPRDPDIKAFLLGELQLVGKNEIVKPLSKLLADPKLCGPAARALVASKAPEAATALVKSLDSVPAGGRIDVIQALGEMRSTAAVKKLLAYAADPDARIRETAVFALANIGDPAARPLLESAAVTASPRERARSASLLLLFARRQWEGGRKEAAEGICRDFIRNAVGPEESQTRASALTLLAEIRGADSLDALLEAAESSDVQFRQKALDLAAAIPGEKATDRWLARLAELGPESQNDVIAMLGRRGDKSALSAVREKIGAADKTVSLAAAVAAARLGGDAVLDEVWPLVWSDDPDQILAIREALAHFSPPKVIAKSLPILLDAPAGTRIMLIEILAERKAREAASLVLTQARSEDANVRKAAAAALESLARPYDVPALISLLATAAGTPDVFPIQNALAAAASQIPEPEARAETILSAIEAARGSIRADLVRALAKIGGDVALAAAISAARNPDAQIQAAGLYALANWLDESALEELWKTARTAEDTKTRYLALQGIARLTGEADIPAERKLQRITDAVEIAVELPEKNVVLSALANIRTVDALKTAAGFLDDKAMRPRAAQAVLKMALPVPGAPGLAGLETAMILKRALPAVESEYDREEAERYARSLLLNNGFTALFNGKNLAGWKGLVADPPKRSKMTEAELKKAQAEADELMRRHWKVLDGALAFDGGGHSLCTLKDYGDFEMFVDWRIQEKGDSGIYLRGSPQVQIWDLTQSPDGSGGLYNNTTHPAKPLVRADRPTGEWNTFYIRMTGERVTVQLNGILVADNVVIENYWEREKPIYPTGQIELQAHSTPLFFKNIYLRVLAR